MNKCPSGSHQYSSWESAERAMWAHTAATKQQDSKIIKCDSCWSYHIVPNMCRHHATYYVSNDRVECLFCTYTAVPEYTRNDLERLGI